MQKVVLGFLVIVLAAVLVWRFYPKTDLDIKNDLSAKYIGAPAIELRPDASARVGIDPHISTRLIELLKQERFEELDTEFESYAIAFESGKIDESSLVYLFMTMTKVDPELLPPILLWAKKSKSWGAYMTAHYFTQRWSWQWRGPSFYRYVPEKNRAEYRRFKDLSVALLKSAKHEGTRNVLWHSQRILMAKQGEGDLDEIAQEAIRLHPGSKNVLYALIDSQEKNWGGDEFKRQDYIHRLRDLFDKEQHEVGAASHYYEGLDAATEGKYAAAIVALEKAIELNSNRVIYYFSLMENYRKLERYNAALDMADVVLEYWPHSSSTLRNKAEMLAEMGEHEQARAVVQKLLLFYPFMRKANETAAKVYAEAGARSDLALAIERGSYFTQDDPAQWARLAHYIKWNLKDYDWALELYHKAYDLQKLNVAANYAIATIHGDRSDCKVVPYLYNYFLGCEAGVSKTDYWCSTRFKNWAYSSVNYLQDHQKCPNVNDYDFSGF